jgi:O-succinylbenzoate synthase
MACSSPPSGTPPVYTDSVELRCLRLPLVRSFETSFGTTAEREILLVRVRGEGEEGWGECVADDTPYYSGETTTTAWYVLRDYLAPRLLGRHLGHPREVMTLLSDVRGHRMAKAAIEMAVWDLFARQHGQPLAAVLGGTRTRIACGVSVGIQRDIATLVERVAEERAEGYRRVKIKIKPGWDVEPVAALRARFPDLPLMVDANAAYDLASADLLVALDEFGLTMIEQPLDEEDLGEHAVLQRRLRTPICLDESIVSARRAAEAFTLGACRVVNIKPGRLGGHAESRAVHDVCAGAGVPVWHGGMLETGIGRAHNVHLSSLANFTLPGDVAASKRYFVPDLVEPPFVVSSTGDMDVPQGPGLGVTVVLERVERATHDHLTLTP